jgi:type III pantothenate kinase
VTDDGAGARAAGPDASRVLAIDVGNTSVTAASFSARTPARGAPVGAAHAIRGADAAADVAAWCARVEAAGAGACVVGSVHPFGARLAAALARAPGRSVLLLEDGGRWPWPIDVEAPERVGVDRLAAARAAHVLAGGAALVAALGTAFTVDWIDAAGVFRGGAIVPGRRLQARALHQFTERLPDVELAGAGKPLHLPGRSTEEAIRNGIDVAASAALDGLLGALLRRDPEAELFVTGGDAEWFAARASRPVRVERCLAARGLALAWSRLSAAGA